MDDNFYLFTEKILILSLESGTVHVHSSSSRCVVGVYGLHVIPSNSWPRMRRHHASGSEGIVPVRAIYHNTRVNYRVNVDTNKNGEFPIWLVSIRTTSGVTGSRLRHYAKRNN